MGNISSNDSASSNKDDGDSDQKYLSFQPTALFNDSFISSLAANLPLYRFPDDTKSQKEKATTAPPVDYDINQINASHQQRLQKLISIFAANTESTCKVEDYDILSLDKNISQSSFFTMENKRGRLLVRMFEAYRNNLAQAKIESKASSNEDKTNNNNNNNNNNNKNTTQNKFWLNKIPESETSQNPLLSANGLSLDMCIAMAKAFVTQDTMLLAILKSLLQSLSVYTPITTTTLPLPVPVDTTSTLTTSMITNTTAKHQLQAILTFTREIYTTSSHCEVQQVCISLQLAIGILLGSIQIILESIDLLLSSSTTTTPVVLPVVPVEILPLLTHCIQHIVPQYTFSYPNELTPEDILRVSLESVEAHKSQSIFSIAIEQEYLYCYDARSCALYKLGNGVKNTTVPGELIAMKANIYEMILAYKQRHFGTTTAVIKPSANEYNIQASMTVIQGQLLIRMDIKSEDESKEKTSEIVILDCQTLECIEIVDLMEKLTPAVMKSLLPSVSVSNQTGQSFHYQYDLQQHEEGVEEEITVCIQCKQGYTLCFDSVLVNNEVDITTFLQQYYLSTHLPTNQIYTQPTTCFIRNVLTWLSTVCPSVSEYKTLVILGRIEYAPVLTDYALPFTSFGYDLVMIQRVFLPANYPNPIQTKGNVYETIQNITFVSLELPPFEATPGLSGLPVIPNTTKNRKYTNRKVLQGLQSLWKEYLVKYYDDKVSGKVKDETIYESMKQRTREYVTNLMTMTMENEESTSLLPQQGSEESEETNKNSVLEKEHIKLTYVVHELDSITGITTEKIELFANYTIDWSLIYYELLEKQAFNLLTTANDRIGTIADDRYLYQAVIFDTKHDYQVLKVENLYVGKVQGIYLEPMASTLEDIGPFPLDNITSLVYNGNELGIIYSMKMKYDDDANSILHRVWNYHLTTTRSDNGAPVSTYLPTVKKNLVEFHLHKSHHAKVPLRFTYDTQQEVFWSIDAHTLIISQFPTPQSRPYLPYLYNRDGVSGVNSAEEEEYLTYPLSERINTRFIGLLSSNRSDLMSYLKSFSATQLALLLSQWLDYYASPYYPKSTSLGGNLGSSLGSGGSSTGVSSGGISGTTSTDDANTFYTLKCIVRCCENANERYEHKLQIYLYNQLIMFGNSIENPVNEHASTSITMNSAHPVGYNIIVFHPESMQILTKCTYNNEEDENIPDLMCQYLLSLPMGTPICIVNVNCIHDNMLPYHYEVLTQYGVPYLQHHYDIRSLIIFGYKGLLPGTAEYTIGKYNETISLSRILTNRFIPLQLEATIDTIALLLRMLSELYTTLFLTTTSTTTSTTSVMPDKPQFALFLSWLQLFQCNIYHFIIKQPLLTVIEVMKTTLVTINMTKNTFYTHLKTFIMHLLSNEILMKHNIFQNITLSIYIIIFDIITSNSVNEKLLLLQEYIEDYEKEQASSIQLMILEVMLRRLSSYQSLLTWQTIKKEEVIDLSAIHHMIGLCQRIILQENDGLCKQLLSNQDDIPSIYMNSMYSTAVNVLFSLLNVTMTCDLELLQQQSSNKCNLTAEGGYPKMLAAICTLCTKIIASIMPYLNAFLASSLSLIPETKATFYQHLSVFLQQSPIGVVLPQITLAMTHILHQYGYPFIKASMEGCLDLINALDHCLLAFNQLLTLLPSEYTDYSDALSIPPTMEKVFESPHNYLSNMNEYIPIRFPPGVLHITIVFDNQSKTENGCDYVQFLDINNKQSLHPSIEKFTGRDGNENWPGTGGRPPLVLNQNEFYLHFHSDGSVEDWGYKFTCIASYPMKSNNTYRYNWHQRLVFQLIRCLSAVGSALLIGPEYDSHLEVPNTHTVSANAALSACQALTIKPESFQYYESVSSSQLLATETTGKDGWMGLIAAFTSEEIAFIQGFFHLPSSTAANNAAEVERTSDAAVVMVEKFIKKMKHHCLEDQGKMVWINTAVYTTGVALLIKYKLIREAIEFTKGIVKTPSMIMIKIWKQIQSIRNQFKTPNNFIATATNINTTTTAPATGTSLPIVLDEEQTIALALPIVMKAKFLVLSFAMNQAQERLITSQSNHSIHTPEKVAPKSASKHASPYRIPLQRSSNVLLSPRSSFVKEDDVMLEFGSPSNKIISDDDELLGGSMDMKEEGEEDEVSDGSLSPMNRSLLLRRQISDDTQNTVKMWDSLVNTMDTTIIQRIKSTFFRPANGPNPPKAIAAVNAMEDELLSCRKVVEFTTNSSIVLDGLQSLNRLHNKRCIARAKGFDVFGRLLTFTTTSIATEENKIISPFTVYLNHYSYLQALYQIKEASILLTTNATVTNPTPSATGNTTSTLATSYGLHYSHGLEASSHEQLLILYDRIGVFFRQTVQVISTYFTQYLALVALYTSFSLEETEERERIVIRDKLELHEKAIISCLQACCLDYLGSDEQLVTESGLLHLLQLILSSSESLSQGNSSSAGSVTGLTTIKSIASSVLEILVGRFIMSSSSTIEVITTPTSSPVTTSSSDTLISQLLRTLTVLLSDSIQQNPVLSSIVHTSTTTNDVKSSSSQHVQVLPLTPYATSYVLPHTTIPFPHSIVFGISRLPSNILDTAKTSIREYLNLQVMRCDDLETIEKKTKIIAASTKYGLLGEIIEISEETKKLKIRWKANITAKEVLYPYSLHSLTNELIIGNNNAEEKIVVIDPLIGGYIFSKGCAGIGNETTTDEVVKVPTIIHISAQLLPDATLLIIYQLNTTKDSGIFLKSTFPIPSLKASLITITCDLTGVVTVWLNDSILMTDTLPMPNDWLSTIGEFESTHPLSEQLSFDKVLPMKDKHDLVGVTFDPQCNLGVPLEGSIVVSTSSPMDSLASMVTFPQDPSNPNDLPGINGSPMWLFPANTSSNTSDYPVLSLQYQKTDVVEGESAAVDSQWGLFKPWGFKMLLQTLTNHHKAGANVASQFPIYLGGVPNYFKHFLGTENTTMPGMLYHFNIEEKILSKEDIQTLQACIESAIPSNSTWRNYLETPVLTILAILKKAVEHANSGSSPQSAGASSSSNAHQLMLKQYFVSSGLVPIVCRLMHPDNYSTATVCAAYHIASMIFPYLDSDYVETIAQENGILAQQEGIEIYDSLLEMLVDTIGNRLNSWADHYSQSVETVSPLTGKSTSANTYAKLRPAVEQQAIIEAKLKLLHSFLIQSHTKWFTRLVALLEQSLISAVSIFASLNSLTKQAFAEVFDASLYTSSNGAKYPYPDQFTALKQLKESNLLYFLIAFFGGIKSTPTIGSSAYYRDENNASNMAEIVTILGPTVVPKLDAKEQKEEAKKWEKLTHFGDATAIVFPMQSNVMVVPTHTLIPLSTDKNTIEQVIELFGKHLSTELVNAFWQMISEIQTIDIRAQPAPLINTEEMELHFESSHPYADSLDHYEDIVIPGAESMEVIFDPISRSEHRHDYVCFYKDASHINLFGEKYSGRDGEQNWPGCEGRSSLIIPASSCVLHFHSDSSTNDWGYKFIVKGTKKQVELPPALPMIPSFSILIDLKMMGLKALSGLMNTQNEGLMTNMLPLLPSFLSSSLAPKPTTTIYQIDELQETELMFESSHPYEDSLDVYTPISVPNASRLIITFDGQTRTEHNCDYLIFYTDNTHTVKIPESETYTGGKDGSASNWPGTNNRPPLIIEGNSFVTYFHSDSSVNDWGYRMFITAEISGNIKKQAHIRGKNMSCLQAERCCSTLTHYLQDGLGSMPTSVYAKLVQFPFQAIDETMSKKRTFPAHFFTSSSSSAAASVSSSVAMKQIEQEESKTEDHLIESKEDDDVEEEKAEEAIVSKSSSDVRGRKNIPVYRVPKPFTPPNQNKCKVVVEKIVAYTAPSKETTVVKEFVQHTILQIVEDKGEWVKIEYEEEVPAEVTEPVVVAAANETVATNETVEEPPTTATSEVTKPVVTEPTATTKMTKKEGYILRREGDNLFFELLHASPFVQEIGIDKFSSSAKGKSSKKDKKEKKDNNEDGKDKEKKINPMYAVQDSISSSSTNSNNALSKGKISSYALLQSEFHQMESAITEYAIIAAVGYAQECTAMIFKHWPMSSTDTWVLLSDPTLYTELMYYLNNCITSIYEDQTNSTKSSTNGSSSLIGTNKEESLNRAKAIMQLLMMNTNNPIESSSAVAAASTADGSDSLSHRTIILANKILSNTLSSQSNGGNTSVPSIYGGDFTPGFSITPLGEELLTPIRRGFVRSIESTHKYENNLNEDYLISFPGAKRIEIQFSPECSTESNYDYLTIYDRTKETKLYEPKIHGYKADANCHWPGVNAPKVILQGIDQCVINFTTDGGTNDWGFAAKVIGIMEESSDEEIAEYEKRMKTTPSSSSAAAVSMMNMSMIPLSTTFAIWMIHYLCNVTNTLQNHIKSDLFTIEIFRLLTKCFIEFSYKSEFVLKSELLEIFVVFIQELTTKYMLIPKESVTNHYIKENETALQEIILEFAQLEKTLLAFGQELYTEDVVDSTGKNLQNVSTLLQATVQLLITIDNAINQLSTRLDKDLFNLDETMGNSVILHPLPATVSAPSHQTYVEHTISHHPSAVILGWDIIFERITSDFPIIGITLNREVTGNHPLGQNKEYFELGFCQNQLFFYGKHVIEYNLDGKTWKEGDVISVIYDKILGMVTFAVNRAVLLPAIGPARMQPAIEIPFTNRHDVQLAISLANPLEDKVKVLTKKVINRKISSSMQTNTNNNTTNSSYEWLDAAKQVDSILQSLSSLQIPPYIIMNKFIPLCHKQCMVDIHMNTTLIESLFVDENIPETKQSNPVTIEEIIHIPSSKSLYFIFKEITLSKHDKIELIDGNGNIKLCLTDLTTSIKSSIHNIDAHLQKITLSHLDTRTNRLHPRPVFKTLELGDRVVRGPDWCYGYEDGGRGGLGTVMKLTSWNTAGQGVLVKWDAYPSDEKLYRYYSNRHDIMYASIQYLSTSSIASSIVKKLDGNAVYLASGMDYLTLRLTFTPPTPLATTTMERKFHCIIIPSFSISHCLSAPLFDHLKQQFQKLYVPKSRTALVALVKHMNTLAKNKGWKRDEVLTRPWLDISPSGEALSRSNALKELFDTESVEFEDMLENDLTEADTKKLLLTEVTNTAKKAMESSQNESTTAEGSENTATTANNVENSNASVPSAHQDEEEDDDEEGSEASVASIDSMMNDLQDVDPDTIAAIFGADFLAQRNARQIERRETRRRERRAERQRFREAFRQANSISNSNSNNITAESTTPPLQVAPEQPPAEPVVPDTPPLLRPITQRIPPGRRMRHNEEREEPREGDEQVELTVEAAADDDDDDDDDDDSDEEEADHDEDDDGSYSEDGIFDDDEEEESDDDDDEEEDEEEDDEDEEEEEGQDEVEPQSQSERIPTERVRHTALHGLLSRRRNPATNNNNSTTATSSTPHTNCDHNNTNNPAAVCGKCAKRMKKHPAGTWNNGWICDWPQHQGPNRFRNTDIVYGCDTIIQCNWGICEACWGKLSLDSLDQYHHKALSNSTKTTRPIEAICSIIQILNISLIKALPFIDLRKGQHIHGTLSYLVSNNRDLLLECVKKVPFEEALTVTANTGGVFDLPLSRFKARRYAAEGKVDTEGRWTVYSQAFRVIHAMPPAQLRRESKLYSTKFIGEHAQDAGGPYRESFDIYCQELQSALLPLLIRTPNGKDGVGYNREKWILNPAAHSTTQLEMFAFLGKLMGVAIRSKEYLALNIPSIIWKLIIKEQPTMEDIEGIEFNLAKSLQLFRTIDSLGVTPDSFLDTFFETFTTTSLTGETIELIPGGKEVPVTFHNRFQYCDLVMQYRLHEFDKQANAVREGLSTIVPITLLSLYSWEQMEEMVCGCAEIDITLLQSITEYSSCSKEDPHIRLFWEVLLHEFSNEERSALIRFTWGRSRLPLTADTFTQRFKIQSFDRSPPDAYFPVAHTCFFSLDLPRYSSKEIMKERLLYAIFNCHAIDADDTSAGSAAAAMLTQEMEEE